MEAITTPPSHKSEPTHLIKSASRLAQMANADFVDENEHRIPHFSVEFAPSPSPPKRKTPLSNPAKLSIKSRNCIPLHELLLLSPSPVRKSRTRLSDRLDMADDPVELRRRCKTRTSSNGFPACASPRNLRRSRRRVEPEEMEFVQLDEMVKPRKKRTSGRSRKDKPSSVSCAPSSKEIYGEENALDRLGQLIWDLVIWRNVAKSSLWFGFGSLFFLSSCFSKGLNISLFSVASQVALLFLAASFISNTLHQRENVGRRHQVKLKEEDILRVIKVVLPSLTLTISKTRELFSGEPSMTLKVATLLLFGAEYGQCLTLWRLCALGFFTSFTAPKLYSSYAVHIHTKAEQCKWRVLKAWGACSHKKIVALLAVTAFWNLSSLKTRVFAAFISLVILRYSQQHFGSQLDKLETVTAQEGANLHRQPELEGKEREPDQASVLPEDSFNKTK